MDRRRLGQAVATMGVAFLLAWVRGGAEMQSPSQSPGPAHSQAQAPELPTAIAQVRFNSGQSIVPYYEGWIKKQDGSFDILFGYFNRNWQQELAIPAGAENKVEPFGPDAGQPTYFLPRRQRWIYRLKVPADFGTREVTWTIAANGRTERVTASMLPAEEITERVVMTNGNFDPGENDSNKAPVLEVPSTLSAMAPNPLTLRATITDDGLPKPRPVPAPRPTTTTAGQANFGGQVNSSGDSRPRGLRLNWIEYRGPARVTFDQAGPLPVTSGQPIETRARFAAPGTYVLRASASDGALTTIKDVTITVSGGSSDGSR